MRVIIFLLLFYCGLSTFNPKNDRTLRHFLGLATLGLGILLAIMLHLQ